MLQQRLLLLFVEGLDLVQVQQHTVGGQEGIQLGYDFLNVRRGGGGGIEFIEGSIGLFGDDVGNGGFAGAAGAVEDHIGNRARGNEAAQHRAFSQNMLLTEDLVQGLGTQEICKRLIHKAASFLRFPQYTIGRRKMHQLFL